MKHYSFNVNTRRVLTLRLDDLYCFELFSLRYQLLLTPTKYVVILSIYLTRFLTQLRLRPCVFTSFHSGIKIAFI